MKINGEALFRTKYEVDIPNFPDLFVVAKDRNYGMIDKNKDMKFPLEYAGFVVSTKDEKWGYLDILGKFTEEKAARDEYFKAEEAYDEDCEGGD